MDVTMDRIGQRLHPKGLLDHALDFLQYGGTRDQARETAQALGHRVVESTRDNPLPAMLIGAGVGWIAWNMQHTAGPQLQQGAGKAQSTASSVRESVSQAVGKVKESAQSAMESTREQAEHVRAGISESAQGGREGAEQAQQRARQGYERGSQTARDLVTEHPLAMGIAALAGGILAGLAFPPSRTENRLMGEQSEELKQQAAEQAKQSSEEAKLAAEQAAQKADVEEAVSAKPKEPRTEGPVSEPLSGTPHMKPPKPNQGPDQDERRGRK